MLKPMSILAAILLQFTAQAALADDELKNRFMGREGSVTADRRENEFDARTIFGPGPKTGCRGDTIDASARINNVQVTVNGSTTVVVADYSGSYTRQGWMKPCVHSPSREDKPVSASIKMTITEARLKAPKVVFEEPPVAHDSQLYVREAAKNALLSGF